MLRLVLAAAACAVLPTSVLAQASLIDRPVGDLRLRVTPYFSYSPSVLRTETRTVIGEAAFERRQVDFDLGSGYGGGLRLEYLFSEPFTVFADGGFVRRGDSRDTDTRRREVGSDYVMLRAGLGMRLREPESELQLRRLGASVYAAPTLILEMPRPDVRRTAASDMTLFGVHFGLEAEVPITPRIAAMAAIDDNFVWWDDTELGRRHASASGATGTTIEVAASHVWQFRFGLTFKFR